MNDPGHIAIRTLTSDDLDIADAIMMSAYSVPRSRKRDLRRYLALQPDGWLLALLDGEPAGVGGAIDYGPFAYIGLMAVYPALQRRGIGSAIMERLLAWIEVHGCPAALLDASAAGERLYEQLGFDDDDKVVQYFRDDCAARPRLCERVGPLPEADLAALAAFDAPIFGASRAAVFAALLAEYPDRAFVARDEDSAVAGYLFAQPQTIGPWAARGPAEAEALLAAALTLDFEGAPRALVPGANAHAAGLLLRYGFSPQRTLRHMRRGSPVADRRDLIYGQTSYAIG
jgi:GNAT superfamily N-acetyltransferase